MNDNQQEKSGITSDAVYRHSESTRRRVTSLFTSEELKALTRRSDLMGALSLASVWVAIAACFALVGFGLSLSGPAGITLAVIGVVLLGGRQLGLAILTHEGSHNSLFKSRWANDVLTDWLCARPIAVDLLRYRKHHFRHHTRTGTDEDSDISLVAGLPTTWSSMLRKVARDLSGLTGLKFLLGRVLMDAELLAWTVASEQTRLPRRSIGFHLRRLLANSWRAVLANVCLWGLLALAGHGELYLAWVLAYLVPYPLFIRIRSMAEHAAMERVPDMFRNTRTTRAGWLARVTVAPYHVNYHLEHHAMASVPWYRLRQLHRTLRARGAVSEPPGYWSVLKIMCSAA